ncbi:MAG: hypothetical protein ACFCD0_05855 [Gemmataceae bacterium]
MSDHSDPDVSRRSVLSSVEAILRKLQPSPPTIDRETIFFEAGKASGRSRSWKVGAIGGIVGVLLGVVGTYTFLLPKAPPPRVVYVPTRTDSPELPVPHPEKQKGVHLPLQQEDVSSPAPRTRDGSSVTSEPEWTPQIPPISVLLYLGMTSKPTTGYFHLRDQALRFGVGALPPPTSVGTGPAGPPQPLQQMRERLLGKRHSF